MATIAIDFGYSATRAAVLQRNGKESTFKIIEDESGNRFTPTVIAFDEERRLVGEDAVDQAKTNPKNSVFEIKRLIGREKGDELLERVLSNASFDAKFTHSGRRLKVKIESGHSVMEYTPEELLATIFDKVRSDAAKYLEKDVKKAVISVPTYFNHTQRRAVINAASIANLEVQRLVNDSTAAAFYHTWNGNTKAEEKFLVVHFGASSLEISIIEVNNNEISVLSTAGSSSLGGTEFDDRLVRLCIQKFKNLLKVDIETMTNFKKILSKLKLQCEKAKMNLETREEVRISLDILVKGKRLLVSVSKSEFELECYDLFEQFTGCVMKLFNDSQTRKNEISKVLLVGGCSRMKKVETLLTDFFEKNILFETSASEDIVIMGAAILIDDSWSHRGDLDIREITPYIVGLEKPLDGFDSKNVPSFKKTIVTLLFDHNTPLPIDITTVLSLQIRKNRITSDESCKKYALVNVVIGDTSLLHSLNHLMTIMFNDCVNDGQTLIELAISCDVNGVYKVKAKEVVEESCMVRKSDLELSFLSSELNEQEIKTLKVNFEKYNEYIKEEEQRLIQQNEFESKFFSLKQLYDNSSDDIKSHYSVTRMEPTVNYFRQQVESQKKCSLNILLDNTKILQRMIQQFDIVSKIVEEVRQEIIGSVKSSLDEMDGKIKDTRGDMSANDLSSIETRIETIKQWANSNPKDSKKDCLAKCEEMKTLHLRVDDIITKNKRRRIEMKAELFSFLSQLHFSSPFENCKSSTLFVKYNNELGDKVGAIETNMYYSSLPSLSDMRQYKTEIETFIQEKKKEMLLEIEERNETRTKIANLLKAIQKLLDENEPNIHENIKSNMKHTVHVVQCSLEMKNNISAEDLQQKFISLTLIHQDFERRIKEAIETMNAKNKLFNDVIDFWENEEMKQIKSELNEGSLSEINASLNLIRITLERNMEISGRATKERIESLSNDLNELKKKAQESANKGFAGGFKSMFGIGNKNKSNKSDNVTRQDCSSAMTVRKSRSDEPNSRKGSRTSHSRR